MVRAIQSDPFRAHGVNKIAITGLGVNEFTRVVASITEVARPPGGSLDFPFIGDAHMTILNVAPSRDGNVYLRYSIGWDSNLDCKITLFID